MRVVYIDHVAKLSGGEIALLRLLPHLREVDSHVILAEPGPFADRLVEAGISTEILPMRAFSRELRKSRVTKRGLPPVVVAYTATYIIRLAIRLRRLRPDLVHTNSLKAGVYGSLAARLVGIPVVWHVRDRIATDYLPPGAIRLIRAMTERLASVVVANSQATLATIGASNKAIIYSVLPDALPSFAAAVALREGRDCTFGMVGRIASWKGQDLFLRAFAQAFPEGNDRAVIIGAPMFGEQEFEHELRRLAQDLSIGERVEFRGFREDIWRELQRPRRSRPRVEDAGAVRPGGHRGHGRRTPGHRLKRGGTRRRSCAMASRAACSARATWDRCPKRSRSFATLLRNAPGSGRPQGWLLSRSRGDNVAGGGPELVPGRSRARGSSSAMA